MDSQESKQKALEYWNHVLTLSKSLFSNPARNIHFLKSFIESVLGTKLLPEIECLSEENKNDDFPCPLTVWMLENFFNLTLHCNDLDLTEDFLIESQLKLLEATYDRSVCEYIELIKLYYDAIDRLCSIGPDDLFFLLSSQDRNVTNAVISPVTLQLRGCEKSRLYAGHVLLRVLSGSCDIFLTSLSPYETWEEIPIIDCLLSTLKNFIVSISAPGAEYVLPLIKCLLEHELIDSASNEILIEIFTLLPSFLRDNTLSSVESREIFTVIWEILKNNAKLSCSEAISIISELAYSKSCSTIENFVPSEIGFLCAKFLSSEEMSSQLCACQTWTLIEKALVLEAILAKELLAAFEMKPSSLSLASFSKNYDDLLRTFIEVVEFTPNCAVKMKTISCVIAMISRVITIVENKGCSVSDVVFFGPHYVNVTECVMRNLAETHGETIELAADCLSQLLTLPEAQLHKNQIGMHVLSIRSAFNTASSYAKQKLLVSIRTIGDIQPTVCIAMCASAVSALHADPKTALQAIRCSPFFCLSTKFSPSSVIADVIFPAMLSGVEVLQLAAVDAISQIACVLSGGASIRRSTEISIKCTVCECKLPMEKSNSLAQIHKHILKVLDKVFDASSTVRRKLLSVLPSFSRHVPDFMEKTFQTKLINLLRDPDVEVRLDFSNTVTTIIFGADSVDSASRGAFSESTDDESSRRALDLLAKTIEEEITVQLSELWGENLHSLLFTVQNLACFPSEKVLLPGLKLVMMFAGSCPVPMCEAITAIAAAHQTSSLILYHTFKPQLSQVIGKLVIDNFSRYNCPVAASLSSAIGSFNDISKNRFITGCEPYMLPIFCASAAEKPFVSQVLTEYAEFVNASLPTIISRSIHTIYAHVWMKETPAVFNAMIRVLEELAIDWKVQVSHNVKVIIYQFLFYFHLDENKALEGLLAVQGNAKNSGINVRELVASQLETRFVGFLLFLVSKFTKEASPTAEKIQSLQSLSAVLKLMGRKRVTPVARKVLATLQTTLSLKEKAAPLQCEAWDSFVRNVDCRELGPLLATVVVSLHPMLEHARAETVRVLTYLLVDQRAAMANYLHLIVFLPDHPTLNHINSSIKNYVSWDTLDIREKLTRGTSLARHETVAVRLEGLKSLLTALRSSSSDVETLINGSDILDSSVINLWEALLECCRDPEMEIALAAGACLGELGAIDPALLPRKLKPHQEVPLSVHLPGFGYLALSEMLRGYQNARTSVDMDAFAVGIQEVMKLFGVAEKDDNQMWMRFSSTDQSLIRPMLASRYKVQVPNRTNWPEVVFGSRHATSHMLWASAWAGKLISLCTDTKAVLLFRACEPGFKRDTKVLQFFLQYILLNIITQDLSFHDGVMEEIMSVLNWSASEQTVDAPSVPLRLVEWTGYPLIRSSLAASDVRECRMTIFLLLDFLQHWTLGYIKGHCSKTNDLLQKKEYLLVKEFLAKIDWDKTAQTNFEMKEYARAVQIWEDMSRDNEDNLHKYLPMLSKAYARYGDLDSVAGAKAVRGATLDVNDQIFYHQVSKQVEEARILYERLSEQGSLAPSQVEGLVLCYLKLGEPANAFSQIQRYVKDSPAMSSILAESTSECLTKLGDWDAVRAFQQTDVGVNQISWHNQISRVCVDIMDLGTGGDFNTVVDHVATTRTAVVKNLAALGSQAISSNQGYQCLIKLHILSDIEKLSDVFKLGANERVETKLHRVLRKWESREFFAQSHNEFHELILSTRRSILSVLSRKLPDVKSVINADLGKCWVKSAEAARKAGCLHQAYNYILRADEFNLPHVVLQRAQLFWEKGQKEDCIFTLTRGLSTHFPDVEAIKSLPAFERVEDRKIIAEARLLYAIYNEETSNCSKTDNMSNYQAAFDVCRTLEKTQVLLAQCLDRYDDDERKSCDLRIMMVRHFGRSLFNGCEYIYQSVPRMLAIWLDLGDNVERIEERHRALAKINKQILMFSEKLPPFVFMTALPQLLSRLCHGHPDVFSVLKAILVKLILAFPQQCLWSMQTIAKSAVPERSSRYKEVINDTSLRSSAQTMKLIEDFAVLADKLNILTNKTLPQGVTKGLQVPSVVRELPTLLESSRFSPIVVPITKFCSIALPKDVTSLTHQPFPKNSVTIAGIKKDMLVLPSLQKPRKISFIGSDGNNYDILCKPKDDLRRDARLMEFNNIVNMYLHRDPDSRARHLHIRTYVVTPLGEGGGLLEWIPNLAGLRPILQTLYKDNGKAVTVRDLKKHEINKADPLEKKRNIFETKVLPMHPPIFYQWFRLNFPDPAGWYAAREAYTRTTAVMSMVGYILGLGDRHGENILFDSESGDTVHVDFNCLFNKGEVFDWKERVPFRLTRNMTVAMGPCGVEGPFRKACEISMRVLRAQEKTLTSVLTPFAYDPFGSWYKNKETEEKEKQNRVTEALKQLRDIERRLKGSLRMEQANNDFYFSVEGLVRALIKDATNLDNLCQMWIGWGAYL